MVSQVFKTLPEPNVLFDMLCDVCDPNERFYVINNVVYNRLKRDNRLTSLVTTLRPHYHKSKQFYLDNISSNGYPSFLTVMRQLCRSWEYSYTSKLKHTRSTYDLILTVFCDRNDYTSKLEKPGSNSNSSNNEKQIPNHENNE